jgi:hypothetical protein
VGRESLTGRAERVEVVHDRGVFVNTGRMFLGSKPTPMKATPRGLLSGRQSRARSRQVMDETRSTCTRAVATGVYSSRWISTSVV